MHTDGNSFRRSGEQRLLRKCLDLCLDATGEDVDDHDDRKAPLAHVPDVPDKIGAALADGPNSLVLDPFGRMDANRRYVLRRAVTFLLCDGYSARGVSYGSRLPMMATMSR
jgi:hypothetical protein